MLRSIYTGITGLGANTVELDVISNNIANSETIGFKQSRVTFQEMMSENLKTGSRPVSGGRGGTNPQQIGLGTAVGSIDTIFTQGTFMTTGVKTDLAINGNGFFVLNDGVGNYYTRAGAFGLDAQNYLVDPATGMKVQGVMADESGVIQSGRFQNISIDPSLTVSAVASSSVQIYGNLNANADAIGSIRESDFLMAAADGSDLLMSLYSQDGSVMDLDRGDQISINGMIDTGAVSHQLSGTPLTIDETTTVDDLLAWMGTELAGDPDLNPGDVSLALNADGSLSLTNNSGGTSIENLQLTCGSKTAFNQTFRFSSDIAPGATGTTDNPAADDGCLRAAATEDDLLTEIYNSRGEQLGLNVDPTHPTTNLSIGGTVGDTTLAELTLLVDSTTTVANFLDSLESAFGISSEPVTIDETGAIIMSGELGTAYSLGDVRISEVGESNATLETSFNFVQTRDARDAGSYLVTTPVYDSQGNIHNVSFNFEPVDGTNQWTWTAEIDGSEVMIEGGSGTVTFNERGEVTSFQYDGGASSLRFRPQEIGADGAEIVSLDIDVGQTGTMTGLTQFAGEDTLTAMGDGYGVGQLVDYHIDQDGMIVGHFSNDTTRNIAQIGMASFANPAGLEHAEGNTFRVSSNTGAVTNGFAGEATSSNMLSGTLEGSNVDLSSQFTRLVIAQRAFQANSRVITTGDEVLQELVSLLR